MAVVTPTDRPKSVRNRCVIELFVALFVLSLCPFDISVCVGAFVTGLRQVSSFFSSTYHDCVISSFSHIPVAKHHTYPAFWVLPFVYAPLLLKSMMKITWSEIEQKVDACVLDFSCLNANRKCDIIRQ